MKRNTLIVLAGIIFLACIAAFGQILEDVQQESIGKKRQLTASKVLENIVGDALKKKIPIEIYPPGYLDWLQKMGDEPMPSMMRSSGFRVSSLVAGDQASMTWIPAGTFTMGSPSSEPIRNSNETQHKVIFTQGFNIGKYEVTQREYLAVMGSNPSHFTLANGYGDGLDRPVENVTWVQASNYCFLLTQQAVANQSIPSGWAYRLPTEAEWEYSCRAGKTAQNTLALYQPQHWYPYVGVLNENLVTTDTWQLYGAGTLPLTGSSGVPVTANFYLGYLGDLLGTIHVTLKQYDGVNVVTRGSAVVQAPSSEGVAEFYNSVHLTDSGNECTIVAGQNAWLHIYSDNASDTLISYGGEPFYDGFSSWLNNIYQVITVGSNTQAVFGFGDFLHGGMANFNNNSEYDPSGTVSVLGLAVPYLGMTTNVGSYRANELGIYDMHGNVSEWCLDRFATYPSGTSVDYAGPTSGSTRVVRGGKWDDSGALCRSAVRLGVNPTTASSQRGFRIVLSPIIPEWRTTFDTQLPKMVFGNYPVRESGKDSLVLVTHGWQPYPLPKSGAWVDGMSNAVNNYFISHSLNNWQVYGYKWLDNAWKFSAPDALANAKQEGFNLGSVLSVQGWNQVHLIGHSAGAEVVQQAAEWIKSVSPSTKVHCTFLDAYVGNNKAGVTNYGRLTDWSDSYFSQDLFTGEVTEQCLSNAYNVEVTLLDPFKIQGIAKIPSSDSPLPVTICHVTGSSHEWSYYYYSNTITGNTNFEYAGLGFPLSMEGGNWNYAVNNFQTGNIPASILGVTDCTESVALSPHKWSQWKVDFLTMPTSQSASGSVVKGDGSVQMNEGSPVWLGTVINPTNPVNTVSFDAVFVGTNGSGSLLSVYWDTNVIGTIDELHVHPGLQHYSLSFPQTATNGIYVLGFRMDPYTNELSSVILTNVTLTQVGVSQPFSLSIVTNSSSGLVYELKGEAGFSYIVQASTNLTHWVPIVQLANTNGLVRFNDQNSVNYSRRFYRAVVPN